MIKKHPEHRIVVVTHAYMDNDDTRLGKGDKGIKFYFQDDNDGDSMWEKFVKKHKNIFLVMSGHICRDSRNNWKFDTAYTETGLLTSKGDHGRGSPNPGGLSEPAKRRQWFPPPNAFHPGEK